MPRAIDTITDELRIIADVLQSARETAGLSQASAAEKLTVSRATVIGWENANRCPSLSMFLRIAKGYGVSPATLLRRISEKIPD